jgi:YD repeat-containing protein
VTSTYTYDETGQVLSITDPCGNAGCTDVAGANHTTTYCYKDSCAVVSQSGATNAYVTKITKPTVNGVTASTYYSHNLADGKLASSTDENMNVTSYHYNTQPSQCSQADTFDRLSEIDYPDGGKTEYCYDDSIPSVTTSELLIGSTWKTNVSAMDELGHVIHSILTTDPDGPDTVDTTYDGESQIYTKTNPYRSTTNGTTTYYYDALGRPVEIAEPDGNQLQWCYNGVVSTGVAPISVQNCSSHLGSVTVGTWVDSTDENSNHWQRTSDSFGRLTEVIEPNGTTQSPSMETDYFYDALDNLRQVNQLGNVASGNSSRTRTFNYDSLSRLLCASNPENSTAACPTTSTGSYIAGTTGYAYDANGNMQSKTDARGITTQFGYDPLNRLISKTYINDTTGTAIACFQYDTSSISGAAGNLVGHLTNAWTQKATSSCSGLAPSYAPVLGSYLSLKSILAYDSMGRPRSAQQQQCVGATCSATSPYTLSMAYDLAGNMTSLTNSVGASGQPLTLTNYFDAASRPCLTTTTWSNNSPLNLFQSNPSTATQGYAPFGGLQNWYLGSNSSTASTSCGSTPSSAINITQGYTNRLWVNSISATGQIP